MEALRCDRCGKFYLKGDDIVRIKDTSYVLQLTRMFDIKPKQRSMDFCEDCKSSFAAWFRLMEEVEKDD